MEALIAILPLKVWEIDGTFSHTGRKRIDVQNSGGMAVHLTLCISFRENRILPILFVFFWIYRLFCFRQFTRADSMTYALLNININPQKP